MTKDNIEEILKNIGTEAVPADVHKIAQETSNNFSRSLTQPQQHILLEYIMRSRIPKLAAAAVIVIAVLVGLNITSETGGVAWGELVEHVEKIKTVVYQMKMKMKGMQGMPEDQPISINMQAKLAYEVGFCIDSSTHVDNKDMVTKTYVLFDEGAIVSVIPQEKMYIRVNLTDELLTQMEKENGDPRATLREMMKNEYTELGEDVIEGVKVEGIEVTEMKEGPLMRGAMFDEFAFRVWVDVETELPVLMTMKGSASNGEVVLDITMDNFDWDAEIDPAELEPNIPEDYELLAEAELGMTNSAEGIAEALTYFAEFADGKYPSSLTGMTVVNEFAEALRAKAAGEEPSEEEMKEVMGNIIKLQTIGMTYATMVQDGNDPAYYGDKVTAEFPHAVLMRWKMADDTYKVIFGDLSIGEVSAEELAELEALPLNINLYPIKPQPADGMDGTALTGLKLSWMPGADAVEHKVYVGTSADELSLLTTTDGTDCNELPALSRDTTYYWRVDAITAEGKVTPSEVWSFSPGYLVAWWKLDDGSGDVVVDSGHHQLDGATVGDPTWAEGVLGGALQFDGDGDYVDFGNNPDFNTAGQITISAWIKVNAFDREYQAIVAKGDSSWRLQRDGSESTLEFACTGLLVPGTRYGAIHGTIEVNDGQWHHVAGTYDGAQICLYVDGAPDTSANAAGSININDQSVYIGENAEKPERFWNGLIDDVRIYSYALSADEITAAASPPK
jgi:outer membrane lipoprotein-sorting protein